MSDKKSFSIEYDFHASPQLLYQYLSTPSGLSEWFADNVNSRGEFFTFIWDDTEEYAKLIHKKNNEKVRFQWQNDDEDQDQYYFEFRIQVDEITKDVSLIISDFSDEDELEESKMLWDNLVSDLKQVLGAS
ncbi:MAG: START-like domain-containing protein [Flavobacteriaceae bacterium]